MIYFTQAYYPNSLGKGYNEVMKLLKPDDWAVFIDGDAMFLANNHDQICEIIEQNPGAGMLTCLTNRVGEKRQCLNGVISGDPNVMNHNNHAQNLKKSQRHTVEKIKAPISGHLMAIKKSVWEEVGGFPDGILGVDNKMSNKIEGSGRDILLMKGVYIFHYYRMNKGIKNIDHLHISTKWDN